LQYDSKNKNIHHHCDLLINDQSLGIKYCPYLENPLSEAGCNLTNGVLFDSTKKKEISNAVNSLDALGFLTRSNRKLKLTKLGFLFAKTSFENPKMHDILVKAVLSYGMCVGVLAQIKALQKNTFSTDEIFVGYPITDESILENGKLVKISTGSQNDSNTRTKSCILAWLSACGFIIPQQFKKVNNNPKLAHLETLDYILGKSRNLRTYEVFDFPNYIFNTNFIVSNPLDYDNFTKNTGALRENGQQVSREITMKFENIIKNRRLAIVFTLNKAYTKNKKLHFSKLIDFLKLNSNFIINNQVFLQVMQMELNFANVCGLPFEIEKGLILKPLVGANENILHKNAPLEIINYLETFEDYE
jgi:hypothetical protein